MPELKKVRVREAKPRDVGLFKKLWKEFLVEQEKIGALLKGSDKNVDLYAGIFNMYVWPDPETEKPQYNGTCVFIGEVGVMMVGDPGNELEMTIGNRPATIWGIYVTPDQRGKGLGKKLYEEGFKVIQKMGFDTAFGNIRNDNVSSAKTLEKAAGNLTDVPERPIYVKL